MSHKCLRLCAPVEVAKNGRCLKNHKLEICNGCVAYNLPENSHFNLSESLFDKCAKLSARIRGAKSER